MTFVDTVFVMRLCYVTVCVVLPLLTTTRTSAVIIVGADDGPNLVAPADDPGWANVGQHGAAATVYLENRWAITANHNNRVDHVVINGESLPVERGSEIVLQNPSETELSPLTDLRLVRLAFAPELPQIAIADQPPQRGDDVILIGRGRDRADELTHWNVDADNGFWIETTDSNSDLSGFKLLTTQKKRWGTNTVVDPTRVQSDDYFVLGDRLVRQGSVDVVSIATQFDEDYSMPSESQGTRGDSGGGLFVKRNDVWELAGIMFTVTGLEGQPRDTAVFGDFLASADLSYYHEQIEAAIRLPSLRPGDANFDLQFDQVDLIRVLEAGKYLTGEAATWGEGDWLGSGGNVEILPVGDGVFDQLDIVAALQSANYLRGPYASLAASELVPEPTTSVLLLIGTVGTLTLLRRRL